MFTYTLVYGVNTLKILSCFIGPMIVLWLAVLPIVTILALVDHQRLFGVEQMSLWEYSVQG